MVLLEEEALTVGTMARVKRALGTPLGKAALWGAGWTALLLWLTSGGSEPAPTVVHGWKLEGDPITLKKGQRYRGCVSVPWPLSPGPDTVKGKAEGAGFTAVDVKTTRPADWPNVECKHYVEATWNQPDKKLDVPGVVKFAWSET